jgi:hypothetical protein
VTYHGRRRVRPPRYRPRPSNILYGLARGLRARLAASLTPLRATEAENAPGIKAVNAWPVSGLSH